MTIKEKHFILICLLFISFSFLIFFKAKKAEAACCNANADCGGGGCACSSCSDCDCGEGRPECCRYDGVCDIGNAGGEDCLNKGFAGICKGGSCYCTSDCPGGNGGGDTHMECDSNCNCVEVDGSGTDECSGDSDCRPCGGCIPCNCAVDESARGGEEEFVEKEGYGGGLAFSGEVKGESTVKETESPHPESILDFVFDWVEQKLSFLMRFFSRLTLLQKVD